MAADRGSTARPWPSRASISRSRAHRCRFRSPGGGRPTRGEFAEPVDHPLLELSRHARPSWSAISSVRDVSTRFISSVRPGQKWPLPRRPQASIRVRQYPRRSAGSCRSHARLGETRARSAVRPIKESFSAFERDPSSVLDLVGESSNPRLISPTRSTARRSNGDEVAFERLLGVTRPLTEGFDQFTLSTPMSGSCLQAARWRSRSS